MAEQAENKNQIGIKLADGKFFPVFAEDFKGRKKLILTTVRDDQQNVQIDLFKGSGDTLFEDLYIGSLVIENIAKAVKGEPEIELSIGIDKDGNLKAEANDFKSGERQSLSVSLESYENKDLYTIPDYELNQTAPDTGRDQEKTGAVVQTIVEDTYSPTEGEKKKGNPLLVILLILLGLAVCAALGWGIYSYVNKIPLLPGWDILGVTKTAAEEPAMAEEPDSAKTETEEPPATEEQDSKTEEKQKEDDTAAATQGEEYIVVWGDTLWDIARRYYRDPFEYKMLAKVNKIPNPDLIFEKQKLIIPAK